MFQSALFLTRNTLFTSERMGIASALCTPNHARLQRSHTRIDTDPHMLVNSLSFRTLSTHMSSSSTDSISMVLLVSLCLDQTRDCRVLILPVLFRAIIRASDLSELAEGFQLHLWS